MAAISAQTLQFFQPLSLSSPVHRYQYPAIPRRQSIAFSITTVSSSKTKNEIPSRSTSRFVSRAVASDFNSSTADILGDVNIFTATGESVLFKDLWDQNELPFPMDSLYADPDRKAYNVLGLYYGIGRTFFNPASAKVFSRFETLQKAVKNYTIEATPDDRSSVLQQGGMFVFKGKQLLYARKDEGTGDHAPLDDIFDVCCNSVA